MLDDFKNLTIDQICGELPGVACGIANAALAMSVVYFKEKLVEHGDPELVRAKLQRVVDRDCGKPHSLAEVIGVLRFCAQFLRDAERSKARVQ